MRDVNERYSLMRIDGETPIVAYSARKNR